VLFISVNYRVKGRRVECVDMWCKLQEQVTRGDLLRVLLVINLDRLVIIARCTYLGVSKPPKEPRGIGDVLHTSRSTDIHLLIHVNGVDPFYRGWPKTSMSLGNKVRSITQGQQRLQLQIIWVEDHCMI
jgi:hypothetical protein